MKTNSSFFLFLFIFVTLTALVNGQSSSVNTPSGTTDAAAPTTSVTENEIEKCLEENNCGSDLDCRARCAQVPNPSATEANATVDCVSKCDRNSTQEAYKECTEKCYETYYYSNSTTPLPSGTNSPSASSKGPSASVSAPQSSSSTPPSISAAMSFLQSRQENLYPLMLLIISVVAGMFGFVCEIV